MHFPAVNQNETGPNKTHVSEIPYAETDLPRRRSKQPVLKEGLLERLPAKYCAKRYLIGVPTGH